MRVLEKKFLKHFIIYTMIGPLSLTVLSSCKDGSNGTNDFSHTVSIQSAVCNATASTITLSVQNNAPYIAIFSADYTFGDKSYGIFCNSAGSTTNCTNQAQLTISPYGNAQFVLDNCTAATAGNTLYCILSPFSKGAGWYAVTEQSISC